MAFEGSAAMVFEHPLQPGDSFTGGSVNLGPKVDQHNPKGLASQGGGSARGDDFARKNPPDASSAASTWAGGSEPSMSNMAREVQINAMQQAAYAGAQQAAQTTAAALQKGADSAVVHMRANPYSVTAMSFVGGLILTLSSLMHLFWFLNMFRPLPYILRMYEFCFGLLIVVIDGPEDKFPQCLRQWAYDLAPFTQNNTQRILFYLFIACLQGSLGTWWNTFCGYYFAAVAFGYSVVTLSGSGNSQQSHGQGQREDRGVPMVSGANMC